MAEEMAERAVSELQFGHGSKLWKYWTAGEGFAKWSGALHKWTTLRDLLLKAGVPAHSVDGLTTNIIMAVMPGYMKLAHAKAEHGRAELAVASINDLPDSAFAYIEPGGKKDATGRTVPRSLRHFPVHDAAHAANALSRATQSPFGAKAMPKIKAACKKFGVQMADEPASRADDGDSSTGRADSPGPMWRPFPISDISVRSGRKGKIVTAYCAVFNTPAPISDQDGDYEEELDPVLFNKAISDARPQGTRANWRCGVFYNHGMTILGTPSDRHSIPLGVPMDVSTDQVGVRTDSEFHNSEFAQEIIEGLESGAIPGFSFSGRFLRSSPRIPRGGFRRRADGSLPTVRRMESTLREYGPTPFPAYKEAAVIGVRAESLLGAMAADPELALRMLAMFRDGTPLEPLPPSGTPCDEEPPPRSRTPVHSGRSIREQILANTAVLLQQQYRR